MPSQQVAKENQKLKKSYLTYRHYSGQSLHLFTTSNLESKGNQRITLSSHETLKVGYIGLKCKKKLTVFCLTALLLLFRKLKNS